MLTKKLRLASSASAAAMILLAPAFAFAQSTSDPLAGLGLSNSGNYNATPNLHTPDPGACFVPAGVVLNASLTTSISTDSARPGDLIQANLNQAVQLGNGQIPAGSVIEGHIASAQAGGFLGRSGRLTIQFDRLRMPNGAEAPMAAHINGNIAKYQQIGSGSNTIAGEGAGTKAGQALLRTALGAGAGAALGTAIGAIAGHGRSSINYQPVYGPYGHAMVPVGYYPTYQSGAASGAGRGAWSGAAIGGGVGLADSLLLRKGRNVTITSGTPLQVQLDQPIRLDRNSQYGNS